VAGGYENGPAVANNKFFFHSAPGNTFGAVDWSYLAFQSDGSFWVGDLGNYRTQYFTAGYQPCLQQHHHVDAEFL
jgi:hypothetical protein